MTYVESKNEPPFNWPLFLKNARKDRITEAEYFAAKERASRWTTCACGNQCAAIPRYSEGLFINEPVDTLLSDLGMDFMEEIRNRKWDKASETLRKIEARSSEILAEIAQQTTP